MLTRPPILLSGDALKRWETLWPELIESGQVSEREADVVAAYCEAYGEWRDASTRLASGGMLVRDSKNRVQPSPWLKIRDDALARMERLGNAIGLNPSNRLPRIADTIQDFTGHAEDDGCDDELDDSEPAAAGENPAVL